ncbi:unnamed protein product [Chondrus crispus]|uniref:Equilibrative nucleoside transporter n=1 Tax=Chondrus crispus TaxID=2769 RepID=R7Q8W2_CHOCR|nr:unnamed protein product [Chondrus crispus]CDF34957.1 unnamed protein product [Chondrus crispus]|eukprot:XP_005714776.1 unnamed protein product [Chondrus crispus]
MLSGVLAALYRNLTRHRRPVSLYGFLALTVLPALLPVLSARDKAIVTSAEALVSKELWYTVLVAGLLGAIGAVLQSVLYGTVTLLPGGKCTTAFTAGGGVASLLLCALRIFSRLLLDGDTADSLLALKPGFSAFFITCSALCGTCVIVFLCLDRQNSFYKEHVSPADARQEVMISKSFRENLRGTRLILEEISRPAWCAFISFVITLALFPGIMVQIPVPLRATVTSTLSSWYPLLVVSLFAVGDTVGRAGLTEQIALRFPTLLPLLTLARVICVPLYLAQWIGLIPVNWIIVMTGVVLLGVGNGVIITLAFLWVPSLTSLENREVAGRLMFVMLICGMSCGNALGWLVETMLRRTTGF